ncbi:MAG: hypothetical protein FWG02_06725 [Holophagaceae bacterium]|nr:hypothetical protein [Holophagaceae bacterium]
MIKEGRGFIIQTAQDTPWAGWFSIHKLDWINLANTSLPLFLKQLGELQEVLPGGISLLWDNPENLLSRENSHLLSIVNNILSLYPRLHLHVKEHQQFCPLSSPLNIWYHSPEEPKGEPSAEWRKGIIGWVPQSKVGWSLPGIGHVSPEHEDSIGNMLWGEIVIPAPAINFLEAESLIIAIEDAQAHIERCMSLRINAGAWPQFIPFQRRQTSWHLSITGGWEYQLSGQTWDDLATNISTLQAHLSETLKCNIQLGVNHDTVIAGILAEQALKYGFPWHNNLCLPPSHPSFSPGISADPRKKSPLESRASLPKAISKIISDPPVALLRVPAIPSPEDCHYFLNSLEAIPAIKWLPPDIPLSGRFHPNIPWDPENEFPPVGFSKTIQSRLFEWDE